MMQKETPGMSSAESSMGETLSLLTAKSQTEQQGPSAITMDDQDDPAVTWKQCREESAKCGLYTLKVGSNTLIFGAIGFMGGWFSTTAYITSMLAAKIAGGVAAGTCGLGMGATTAWREGQKETAPICVQNLPCCRR